MFKIQTLNKIATVGLNQLDRDNYEIFRDGDESDRPTSDPLSEQPVSELEEEDKEEEELLLEYFLLRLFLKLFGSLADLDLT